jgi:glyoxylase-like metal-dependent hydrolase (beta-lactamase superfamily II)
MGRKSVIFHKMKIRGYNLFPVPAGRFRLDGGAMFGVVPKVLWSREHPADELNRVEMVSRSLLVAGEGRLVLLNTGMGQSWPDKERAIYAVDEGVRLERSLAELGYRPEEVTHVVQTHLHFDHAGGLTANGGGGPRPLFPRAEYIVQKRHFQWAQSPSERDRASFRPDGWECWRGQLRLVEGEEELLPGLFLHLVHGHTPGQQLVRVSDGHTSLLYCSDLVPLASQVRVPWIMAYDLNPLETLQEKRRLLGQAAAEGWLLFLEHDPAVAACRVRRTLRGFEAEPVSLADAV